MAEPSPKPREPSSGKPRFLIANSDVAVLDLMAAVLVRRGLRVTPVVDGAHALALVATEPFDVVICDLDLDTLAGDVLCREIRVRTDDLKTILLCPPNLSASRREKLQSDCDAIVSRPFRYSDARPQLAEWGFATKAAPVIRAASFVLPPAGSFPEIAVPSAPERLRPATMRPLTPMPAAPSSSGPSLIPIPIAIPMPGDPAPVNELRDAVADAPTDGPEQVPELDLDDIAVDTADDGPELDLDDIAVDTPDDGPEIELDDVVVDTPGDGPEIELDDILVDTPDDDLADSAELGPEITIDDVAPGVTAEADLPEIEISQDDDDEVELIDLFDEEPAAPERSSLDLIDVEPPAAPKKRKAGARPSKDERLRQRREEGRTVLPVSVPRFGDLDSMPLPRLIFELYLATYSGVVHLSRKGAERSLYFLGGFPVRVDSKQLSEALGTVLIERGSITAEELQKGQDNAVQNNMRLGAALIDLGLLSESELLDAMREQTELKVVNTFAWRDGTYKIEDGDDFADASIVIEIHPMRAIWRGVHQHYDLNSLFTFLSRLGPRYIVATDLFGIHFKTLGPFLRDVAAEPLLDGKTTFEAAMRSDDARVVEIAQLLYVLLVTDMVRASPQPGEAAIIPEELQTAKEGAKVATYKEMTDTYDMIAKMYLRLKDGDPAALLGVDPAASEDTIDAAFDERVALLLPRQLPAGLDSFATKRAREIVDGLGQARDLLTDPDRRSAAETAEEPAALVATASPADEAADRERLMGAEQRYRAGQQLLASGDLGGAMAEFQTAVEMHPTEPTYHVGLAQATRKAHPDEYNAATVHLRHALDLDPGNVGANLELARVSIDAGDKDSAKTYLFEVVRRAPQHPIARKLLAELMA